MDTASLTQSPQSPFCGRGLVHKCKPACEWCQIVGPPNMFVRSYLWCIGGSVLYSHVALHIQTGIVRITVSHACVWGGGGGGRLGRDLESTWFLKDNRLYKPVSHRGGHDLYCTESVSTNEQKI